MVDVLSEGAILINPRRPAETAAKLTVPPGGRLRCRGQSGETPETASSSHLHPDRGTSAG
jgi:hypothetical protein